MKPIFDKLKKIGLDLNFTYNKEQPTALIQAIIMHSFNGARIACWFVENGADINVLTPRKQNAAMFALMNSDLELMDKIVDHPDFNINHQEIEKYTPLLCCFYHKNLVMGNRQIDKTRCPHIYNIVKKLLAKGANPLAMSDDGKTPLGLAQEAGDQPLIELLEKAVADFNLKKNADKV